jgi:hypothetical protein
MDATILQPESKKAQADAIVSDAQWTPIQKVGFRFIFSLLTSFMICYGNPLPFIEYPMELLSNVLHVIVPWIGKNILNLSYEITVFTNGSGDTTYDYVTVFFTAVVAGLATIAWSIVDRKRKNYIVLFYWLTVAVRYYVALVLISYGLIKVFKSQFPAPGLFRLTQPYGNSSPMGLAWTFLGFSTGYNLFMGLAEVAAVLLVFRRTMILGAIITFMTTANVVAVNYFYDVPVKIYSTALLVMTVFVLAQHAPALFNFFIRNIPAKLDSSAPIKLTKSRRIAVVLIKTFLVGYALIFGSYQAYQGLTQYGYLAPKPPMYGLYKVKHYILGSDTIPPLMTDKVRWRQMSIEFAGFARVNHMTDSMSRFFAKIDTVQRAMDFKLREDSTVQCHFKYRSLQENEIELRGLARNDSVRIVFDRFTDIQKEFLLTSRGFHWINESPFNR